MATSQPPVMLGSGVSPHFELSMKVMREIYFTVNSDLISLSLATSWSAVSLYVHWMARHGFAVHDVPSLNKMKGVSSHPAAFSPLLLLVPACCCAHRTLSQPLVLSPVALGSFEVTPEGHCGYGLGLGPAFENSPKRSYCCFLPRELVMRVMKHS